MKERKPFTIFVLLIVLFYCPVPVSADVWTQKANYPGNGRSRSICFSIDDKGYIGCGNFTGYASDFWQYDTTLNTWTAKAAFGGGGRWSGVSFAVNGFGYAGLGWSGTMKDDIWQYDPIADAWTQMSNFPAGQRQVPTSFVIDSKAYVVTGRNVSNIFQNDLWEYDSSTDTWTQKANLPGLPRSQPFAFSIDSLGYTGAGFDQSLNGLNDFYEYSPTTNSWTTKASLPAAGRGDPAGFAIGCRGYAGTGQTLPVNNVLNDFWEYNPVTDQWIAKTSFGGTARDESAFFVIGGKGYLGLGGVNGASLNNDFWEYTPDTTCITILPSASFIAPNHICPGTCTDFTNLSSNGSSYLWSFPGANPSTSTDFNPTMICYNTPGNYPVTLIVTNAFTSDTLTLNNFMTVFPFPAPQGISQSGDTLFANQGATAYQWYFNGTLISGATDYFIVATTNGDYSLVATNANGCEVEAVIFDVATGLSPAFSKGEGVKTFPNPVKDKLTIVNSGFKNGPGIIISIYNLLGEKVKTITPEEKMLSQQSVIDISDLSKGIYWLNLRADEKSFSTKFIKQ